MNNPYIFENIFTEQVIVNDVAIIVSELICQYAFALSNIYSANIRKKMTKQLQDAVLLQDEIAQYLQKNGFNSDNVNEQITYIINKANKALNLEIES